MNPWFPYRKPRPEARLRLFCFPHAGAGASAFRGWIERLPDVDVCAVQYPGRETRFSDPLRTSLAALAEGMVDAAGPEFDRPFAFFGHSMGALAAYEAARILRRRGAPSPQRLIVSARSAPHLPSARPPAHALPEEELLAALRRYSNRADDLLAHRDLLQLFLPVLRADLAAAETYRPETDPLAVPITVFGGLGDADITWHRLDAWRMHTTKPIRLCMFPGGHFYLQPPTPALLRLVGAELTESGGKPASIPGGEVGVWKIALEQPEIEVNRLTGLLSPEEQQRAGAFSQGAERNRFIVGRAALRSILGTVLGRDPGGLPFDVDAQGKPFLQDGPCIGLSQGGDLALVAVAGAGAVGIDLERVRADLDGTAMSLHALPEKEQTVLAELPAESRLRAYLTFRTRKEATTQAIASPEQALATIPADPQPLSGETRRRWALADLHPEPGYVAALAVAGGFTHLRLSAWESSGTGERRA